MFNSADNIRRINITSNVLSTQINGVSIDQLFEGRYFYTLLGFALLIFGVIFGAVMYYRERPFIKSRSPLMILMIVCGVFFDTMVKLIIMYLPFTFIDLKCQLSIITRVVFHYIAYLFILFRILRMQ